MTAFRPISPAAAVQILDAASVGAEHQRLLADLAMAGVIKAYARLIESDVRGGARAEVRDSRIDRSIWRRIVGEDRTADIFATGSVHLGGQGFGERISVIGIRFDASSVTAAASDHGLVPPPPTATSRASKPKSMPQQTVLPLDDAAEEALREVREASPQDASRPKSRGALDPNAVALSKDEATHVVGVSLGTVNNLIRRGDLSAKKVGRRVLVQADSVRSFMA
ncbi:helix-turn-helix domain-containing protein [uncultured Sphingomonas sp.]|uniref:helix-turn-helix domain-containing protein n=1 Tax=uncultured Sphingomonas sp. TaxID=158754 RepID=UPI0037492A2B